MNETPAQNSTVSATLDPAATESAGPLQPQVPGRLRLWPAVLIVALLWLVMKVSAWAAPGTMIHFNAMFLGPMLAAAAVLGWWLFASGLPWRERWLGLSAFIAAGAMAVMLAHPTMRGMPVVVFALPTVVTAWVGWLVFTPFLGWPLRRAGLIAVFILGWGYFTLLRLDGIDGSMVADVPFRWAPTREQKFLASIGPAQQIRTVTASSAAAEPLQLADGDWPGFRGPDRDGRLPGVRIDTDWQRQAPRELWRHPVGPGWSSFAVVGNRLYTQEQHADEEVVICYEAATGDALWIHRDADRFDEAMGGPGPRATPTFHNGNIYALGARGQLNCLDARTGDVVWTHDIKPDASQPDGKPPKLPTWGFSASPLVVDGIVTVFAGGAKGKSVLAYDALTGKLVWSAGDGQFGYGSTQLSRLAGVDQLLIATGQGLAAFQPADGKVLWTYDWQLSGEMSRCIQPAIVGNSDVLIGTGFGYGTRRVHVVPSGDKWSAKDVWPEPSIAIRPYYNDLVVHGEHLYGFDGNFFTCVSLSDGKSRWKTRGYGNGQVLLLPDQDLLVVLSETGEVVLVAAKPDGHNELARFKAIEGKTWNHPVIAYGKLLIRNGEEAAAFELTEETEPEASEAL
jgi:outer membrane protein assembly factor BamB